VRLWITDNPYPSLLLALGLVCLALGLWNLTSPPFPMAIHGTYTVFRHQYQFLAMGALLVVMAWIGRRRP